MPAGSSRDGTGASSRWADGPPPIIPVRIPLLLHPSDALRQKGCSRAMKTRFGGKILLIGCGYVGRCTLPLLLRHLGVPADRITVLDFVDARAAIADSLAKGVKYVIDRITPDNMASVLASHVGPGDVILDLRSEERRVGKECS